MVAHLLTLLLVLLFSGCVEKTPDPEAHAHDALPCVRCHDGALAAKGLAGVESRSCTTAGCHPDGGPEAAHLDLIQFSHRRHGSQSDTPPACAGCHAHDQGDDPLVPSLDSCVLCHRQDILSVEDRNCMLCHSGAVHQEQTSQGARVNHAWSPGLEDRCTRCHYDVGDAPVHVGVDRCLECHSDAEQVLREGIGRELHPTHTGFSCQRCHGETSHRMRAVSSAVDLVCSDCHATPHPDEPDLAHGSPDLCNDCHEGIHVEQQRLMLGLIGESADRPSQKFMAGLNCRSCHGDQPATATACGDCHGSEYDRVLGWWTFGLELRSSLVRADIDRAQKDLDGSPTAIGLADQADRLLRLVELGGGVHNMELSDWIFHRNLELVDEAYREAGRFRPERPHLGNPARVGYCTYCHYGTPDPLELGKPLPPGHDRYLAPR